MAADLAQLLLPLLVIVAGATVFRAAFQRLRQPAVLGEIVFGILLGASLLGWLWPSGEHALFPKEAMPSLNALGWIGLALFMFSVGTEMRWHRGDGRTTATLAYGALLLPFALGIFVAASQPGWFFDGAASLQQLALVAVVMCVSALPVLARILEHHGLLQRRLGAVILGAGTIDDLFAWGMLAFIITTAGVGLTGNFALNVALVLGFFGAAFVADRALSRFLADRPIAPGQATLALLVCAILGSAWLT
ncbi:MAG: cation:proton antiporter, partial [Halobacteriales archaeon]|nr:cation:proton antiporter [Halobacteriales archaeon]